MSESGCDKSLGSKTMIIRSAFLKICSDTRFQRRLWNKWLPAETWIEGLAKSKLIHQTLMAAPLMLQWGGARATSMAK